MNGCLYALRKTCQLVRPQVNCSCCLQGRPVYLGEFGCSFYFEWESFEFCTDLEHPANEIPCFVYNNSQLIDLSPLTKLKGGYLVTSENRDFYINVCRDLTPGESWLELMKACRCFPVRLIRDCCFLCA